MIHDAEKLISTAELDRVDSTPRIEEPEKIDDRNSFVGLEHRVSQEFAGRWEHAADAIDGWTSPDSFFFSLVLFRNFIRFAIRAGVRLISIQDMYQAQWGHTICAQLKMIQDKSCTGNSMMTH